MASGEPTQRTWVHVDLRVVSAGDHDNRCLGRKRRGVSWVLDTRSGDLNDMVMARSCQTQNPFTF
jgi:hypothetical protein